MTRCLMLIAITVLMVLASAASPADTQVKAIAPRVEHVRYHSDALGKRMAFTVVLPEGYSRREGDWPVLVILHGRGRSEMSLLDDERARAALLKARCVLVLPRGEDGWYIDSPVQPHARYEAYLDELLAIADRRYRLSDDRSQRAIAGWSMGGYGAVRYAQQRSANFGAVASIIGLLDFPRTGLPKGQSYKVPIDRFGENPEVWTALNPMTHAAAMRNQSLLIITADRAFDRTMNEHFHARLQMLGIDHGWEMHAGGHTFDVVVNALPAVIAHAEASMQPNGKNPNQR